MAYLPLWGAYVLDKDGTLLNGTVPIPGAGALLRELGARGTPYIVLSNTGERGAAAVAADLGRALDVSISAASIYTAREHMAAWLARQTTRRILVIGTPHAPWAAFDVDAPVPSDCSNVLLALFSDGDLPDYVQTMTLLGEWVRRGATLCCTSMDDSVATVLGDGTLVRRPGPGIFASGVMALSGRSQAACRAFGKGSDPTLGAAVVRRLRDLGYRGGEWRIRMVGDRLDTDVQLAGDREWSACLVESGCHHIDDNHMRRLPVHTVAASVRDLLDKPRMHPLDLLRTLVGKASQAASASMPARRVLSCPARLDEIAAGAQAAATVGGTA